MENEYSKGHLGKAVSVVKYWEISIRKAEIIFSALQHLS
jgi:hypothetical protein